MMVLVGGPALAQDRGARGDDASFGNPDDQYVPPPKNRLYYTNATFARVNPLGLIDIFRVGWRRRLSTSDSVLLQDTYTFVGTTALVTPAYARLGAYAEAQLLSVFRVFAQAEGIGYFGTFDQVLSFSDQNARYSDQTIIELGDEGLASPRGGWVFLGGATLRAAAGPIAIRSTGQVQRYDIGLPDGDVVFYDQYWDRLAPNGGFMYLQDTDLLLLAKKARIGVRHTFTDNLDGSTGDGGLAHHRVGPLLAWQFKNDAPGAKVNQQTLFLLAQWWAQHPYRTGEEQPAGLPLIALGFAFNGDPGDLRHQPVMTSPRARPNATTRS